MNVIKYNVNSGDVCQIGRQYEYGKTQVIFEGYQVIDSANEIYFKFVGRTEDSKYLIPIVDMTLDITQQLTKHVGQFSCQLEEMNTEGTLVSHSPVFYVAVKRSIKVGADYEVQDSRLETIYQKYNQMYNTISQTNETSLANESQRQAEWLTLKQEVSDAINSFDADIAIGEYRTLVQTETNNFNTNAETKFSAYNQNDSQKTTAYNQNADNRLAEFDTHTEQIQTDISELKSDLSEFEEGIANCEIINRLDKSKVTEGYIYGNGNFASDSNWRCTDFIPCNLETLYFSCNDNGVRKKWGMSFVASYDSNKNLTDYVNTISDGIYTGTNENGFVRFAYRESSARTDYMIRTDDSYNDYYEYNKAYTIKESSLPISALADKGVLYGKKYCACGDSYTEGAFDGSPDNSYLDENGIPKTYHYFIGKRNGMEVINCGKSGSIMALNKEYVDGTITNPNMDSPFAYQRYLEVPLDSDYITLAFGINDASKTNLGTIDDTTNETFYGAWNVVLDYFLQNAPFAKIGIIIYTPNQQYHDAIIDIAKKWGKKVLDFSGENSNLPWFMPERIGMSAEINAKYKELYRVSDTNKGHPSWQAHEFESTIIEDFLRSL